MLRSEVKSSFLLIVFCVFLKEYLTFTTLGFVLLGALAVVMKLKPHRYLRNALALGVLFSYWFSYGKVIDPEVGLNFLVTVIVIKLLERESLRDDYMIFFGLLLVISAGSLFERTISYVGFFAAAFLILIHDFYRLLNIKARMKEVLTSLVWVIPFALILFFFVPRLMSPIPFQLGGRSAGEVGYTSEVNISQLESLTSNNSPAFQVTVSKNLYQKDLYWRGNILSQNDGWNWQRLREDRRLTSKSSEANQAQSIMQNFRSFSKEDFFFTLDHPQNISFGNNSYELQETRTLSQSANRWISSYQVSSLEGGSFQAQSRPEHYLSVKLNPKDKEWINQTFRGISLSEITTEIQNYFQLNEFSYSLSPGKVESFRDFMLSKKIGLCSHYASAVGLILRTKKIPSRLVSGFMGGSYNRFANYYLVSQNDAHVWVEVLIKGKWKRIDPTEWIAPERVNFGGEAFMNALNTDPFAKLGLRYNFPWFNDLKQWFGQWDFRFYQWLEEFDYFSQEAWLLKINFKREWFYSLTPLLLALFLALYALQMSWKKKFNLFSEEAQLWQLFVKKLRKKGLDLPLGSVQEGYEFLIRSKHPQKAIFMDLWQELVDHTYGNKENSGLKEKIKSL